MTLDSRRGGMGVKSRFHGNLAHALLLSLALHAALALLLILVEDVGPAPSGSDGPVPLALLDRPSATGKAAAKVEPVAKADAPVREAAHPPVRRRLDSLRPEAASQPVSRVPETGTPPTPVEVPGQGEPGSGIGAEGAGAVHGSVGDTGSAGISTAAGTATGAASEDSGREVTEARRNYALEVRRTLERAGRYPMQARRLGLSGKVLLRIRVDSSGKVTETLLEATSRHSSLDRAAMASTVKIRTLPPPPGGAIDILVPVVFTLNGTGNRRSN
jgi:protein TonB